MVRGVIRRNQNYASSNPSRAIARPSVSDKYFKMPAIALAFLMAILTSVYVVGQASQGQSATPIKSDLGATSEQASNNSSDLPVAPSYDAPTAFTQGGTVTNSVTTQTAIDNGQANVKVQVNGEDIPVPQSGSSSQTIESDGSRTNIDVSINNGQASTTTSGSSTNTSTSFSTSFQSLTISGNN